MSDNSNNKAPLFIFLTSRKHAKNEKRLSFKMEEVGTLNDKKVYKKYDNLIFYNAEKYKKRRSGEEIKKIVKEIISGIEQSAKIKFANYEKLYVFLHGADIKGSSTNFSYDDDLSKKLPNEINNVKQAEVFYFTHSEEDPVYQVLGDYKQAFEDANVKYKNETELNDALDKYINKNKKWHGY